MKDETFHVRFIGDAGGKFLHTNFRACIEAQEPTMYRSEAYDNRLSERMRKQENRFGGITKANQILDAFFDPEDRSVRSFREAYTAITGDKRVTGQLRDCDPVTFREAIGSSTWANVLGDAITRRMMREYNLDGKYEFWRKLVNISPVKDFRTQHLTRYAGYGDLPIVAENDPYPALTTPADEEATYALVKRGGTESITLEATSNDNVGAIQLIPKKLALAAKRTLAEFVMDFIKDNPVIYDGVPLFHASHGNLGSAALSAASVGAGRVAMKKQTDPGSTDVIGVNPVSLLVPFDLEEVAYNIFQRKTNNDRTFIESMQLDIIPVYDWDDADDWALAADPNELPCIEIGFLDGNEDPELFLQDDPIGGSLFSNDRVTYKIRHIYGGVVKDFRGLYKSAVP